MRREDYQPRRTPAESPFRKFDVRCLRCGSHQLRLVAQFDEVAGEMSVVLLCNRCPQQEIMPINRKSDAGR
jgi:hypothetical protein